MKKKVDIKKRGESLVNARIASGSSARERHGTSLFVRVLPHHGSQSISRFTFSRASRYQGLSEARCLIF